MNLLICSASVPYDKVDHAGGQIHNYYLKRLKNETCLNIRLITCASISEKPKIDLDRYKIEHTIIYKDEPHIAARIQRKICNFFFHYMMWFKYGNFISGYTICRILHEIKHLKKQGYYPDIIELDWTQIVFMAPLIKKIYLNAKYCALEHDVTFLKFERLYLKEKKSIKKLWMKLRYTIIRNTEVSSLSMFDLVYILNKKDSILLKEHGIANTKIIPPYFNRLKVLRERETNSIIFYGSMERPENYKSALWFIENVFLKIKDLDINLVILGSNPHQSLFFYQSDRIVITGFQEDITPWFEKAFCLVAPLVSGAGIKIKVLEALSAGIPVLGNMIAVEGIGIRHNIEYFHCEVPNDYIITIRELIKNPIIANSVANAGRKYIDTHFNFEIGFFEYTNSLFSLKS